MDRPLNIHSLPPEIQRQLGSYLPRMDTQRYLLGTARKHEMTKKPIMIADPGVFPNFKPRVETLDELHEAVGIMSETLFRSCHRKVIFTKDLFGIPRWMLKLRCSSGEHTDAEQAIRDRLRGLTGWDFRVSEFHGQNFLIFLPYDFPDISLHEKSLLSPLERVGSTQRWQPMKDVVDRDDSWPYHGPDSQWSRTVGSMRQLRPPSRIGGPARAFATPQGWQ